VVRKPIIAGNWKMNLTIEEAKSFMMAVDGLVPHKEELETIVCVPFTHIQALVELVREKPIFIGAQNMHFEENGAYTGEVSPKMLSSLEVKYVIIGHSERRQFFNETNETVNQKAHAAHNHGLTPIICVGENEAQWEARQTKEVVKEQVVKALANLNGEQVRKSVLAYEPIWAIGTGRSSSSVEANEVISYIRSVVEELYGIEVAQDIRIQYGGSVKPENIKEYMSKSDIDGALVGGASLKPESFLQLLEGRQE
jgi:triosephosphate isomerase